MINYIVQVLLFQTVFLVVYDLILKKETFFQWNRAYLIFTSLFAYIIPLLKFPTISQNLPKEYMVMLPEVMLSPTAYMEKYIDWSVILFEGLNMVFLIGIAIATLLFMFKLWQIVRLISNNNSERTKEYNLVLLKESNMAFSFFNFIFLGITMKQKDEIIQHELIHVKEKHSMDLLLFEIQKIVFWFNPYSYMYQKRISEIHEYIADNRSVSKKDRSTFYHSLLAKTFAVDKFDFVNAFNKQSLIKKRIIMYGKNKSKEILKFKYLFIIPILAGMVLYNSCEVKDSETSKNQYVEQEKSEEENQKIGTNENTDSEISGNISQEVPFTMIDQTPIFPGCENAEDQKACFIQKITEHVAVNFNASISKNLGMEPGKKKIFVQFTIDKEGNITNIKSRGPHKDLETEAVRVASSLPQMQPGVENGNKVAVKFTLPITLVVD